MAGNEAVISLRATGGAAVQEQIERVRQSLEKTKKSSLESSEGFRKVTNAFENLSTGAIGLNGPLGQLGEGIIAFAPGGPIVVAALAGLTLVATVYTKLEKAAKDTKLANDDLARSFAELSGKADEFDYQKALTKLEFAVDAVNTYRSRGTMGQKFTLLFGNPEQEYASALAAVNRFGNTVVQKRDAAQKEEEAKQKERESKYKTHTNTLKKLEQDRLKDLVDETKMTYEQVFVLEQMRARNPAALAKAKLKTGSDQKKAADEFYAAEVGRLLDKAMGVKSPTTDDILGKQSVNIDFAGIAASVQTGLSQLQQTMGGGALFGQFAGLAASMEDAIADNFGTAILNGFQRAVETGNPIEIIRGFGSVISGALAQSVNEMAMTWLSGIGKMFARQAAAYLQFGNIMKALSKFLTNPFTAGFAAAAIGAGLYALSRRLGAQASSSVTGNGFGGAMSNDFSQTQQGMARNGIGDANIVIQGGILDMSNPEQARSFANALETLSGRRVTVMRG